tara:strand:+ start:2743 stop:4500 length:1758 start_codon:yes stop_codon:yes gene_type:complete
MADDLNINIKTNVKDASKGTEKLAKNTGKATKETTLLSGAMGKVKLAMAAVGKTAKMMFGSIKAGIISSGIGALVLGVIALFSYFTKTQRGAEMLERALAGVGAVVDVITDLFSKVGEVMVGAFRDPKQAIADLWEAIKKNLMNRLTGVIDGFQAAGKIIQSALKFDWDTVKEGAQEYGQALIQVGTGLDVEQQKAFADGVKNIAKEMNDEADAAMRLKGILQGVRREEMEFSKVQAQTRQEVAKARLLAMDESLSQEKRLEAINEVMAKEMEMTEGLIALQQKKVNAQREVVALGESMIEDEEELMALEVELINLTTQSTMTQKRLMTEVEALGLEIAARDKAAKSEKAKEDKEIADQKAAEAKALLDVQTENMLSEIENLQERALKELEIQKGLELAKLESYENYEQLKAEIDEKYKNKADKVNQSFKKKELKWEKMTQDQKLGVASTTAGNMAKIMGEESEAGKAFAVVQATIDTYRSAVASYASMAGLGPAGPALGAIAAAAAVVSGLANVKAIMSADSSGGGTTPSTPSTTGGTPRTTVASGAFTLGGGEEPDAVKAFVVTDDVTNSQSQLANIRRRATI